MTMATTDKTAKNQAAQVIGRLVSSAIAKAKSGTTKGVILNAVFGSIESKLADLGAPLNETAARKIKAAISRAIREQGFGGY